MKRISHLSSYWYSFVLLFFVTSILASCGTHYSKEEGATDDYQTVTRTEQSLKKDMVEDMVVEEMSEVERVDGDDDEKEKDFNTEEYDIIRENPFLSPVQNPLSTFAIDVDKASYSNVRRILMNNQKPNVDAVRIEEFINYFDYNYPQPTGNHPFSVNVEMTDCPWNDKHQIVSVGLKGKETSVSEIPPANLVLLLDVSGSMNSPEKLPLLKQALKVLMKQLRPSDRVAIVVYAGAAGLVLPSTPCSDSETIINAFDKLSAGGSTAGGEGIVLAYKIAKDNFIEQGNNRVILATDGDFNIGASSDAEMERLIEKKREEGVFLTVLGFGMGNYKDSKMEKLSNAGNGNYAYIDNVLEAKKVLGHEMWRTLYTIAKDVKIQIEFNPAKVKGYRLIGYENRLMRSEDFNDDTKDAGEIGAGHTVTAMYEIIPAGSNEEIKGIDELEYQKTKVVKSNNLMTLKLRYKQPEGDKSELIKMPIIQEEVFTDNPSENLMFASAVTQFALLIRDSEYKGNSSFSAATALARKAKGEDKFGYRAEFIRLIETAELLYE